MKAIDFSRATFSEICDHIGPLRLQVWRGLQTNGPCTTSHLATALGMSILTVRPRVTELMQVGLVKLTGAAREGREGVYAAMTPTEVREAQAARALAAAHPERQLDLRIGA